MNGYEGLFYGFGSKCLKIRKIFKFFEKISLKKLKFFKKLMYKNAIKMLRRTIFKRFYQIFGVFIPKNMALFGFQKWCFFWCFAVPRWCFRPLTIWPHWNKMKSFSVIISASYIVNKKISRMEGAMVFLKQKRCVEIRSATAKWHRISWLFR